MLRLCFRRREPVPLDERSRWVVEERGVVSPPQPALFRSLGSAVESEKCCQVDREYDDTMFNVGGGEIFLILLLALLLLGPDKLPDAARRVGKLLAEVRRVTSGFEEEVRSAMDLDPAQPVDNALDRTTDGPRLVAPVEPAPTMPQSSTPAAFVGDLSEPVANDDESKAV